MAETNKDTQFRFLIAVTLSMAILFGWTYLFPGAKPDPNDANANVELANANVAENTAPEVKQEEPKKETESAKVEETPDDVPNKEITVKTPLYQVKLDSKGAVATSWILLKNVSPQDRNGNSLFASGSNGEIQKPLELVSPEGLASEPREVPFRLSTGDPNIDKLINQKNYQVSVEQNSFEIEGNQTQQVDFVFKNEASSVEVTKSFTFRADSYLTDLKIKVTKDGQVVPNTKLLIGASIADQAVNYYNFYQVQPEGVAFINGDSERFYSTSIVDDKQKGIQQVPGTVDWAGVGDTYFAMAAIPAQPMQGLEFHAIQYEKEIEPVFSSIFQWILRNPETKQIRYLLSAYVPIPADGSTNKIYTGTKDSFVLTEYNEILTQEVGRPIDVEELINYGYLGFFVKPISHPILIALNFLFGFTHNYGWAIIIFTIFFYSLLFPFRWYQSKSFKKSAANAPKMKELQEKMKEMQKKGVPQDDPKMRELQMQQLRMTKDALPIGGCLPMLLQFPFLIALYYTVSIALGFRQAEFMWLPDLSAGDPYHILEFGFAFSMILSMKFSPTAAPTSPEQVMQQKLMTYFMPIMMLWIMWAAPSGLLLYWFVGNIIMFGQQMIINRMNKTDEPAASEAVIETAPVVSKKKKKKKGKLS